MSGFRTLPTHRWEDAPRADHQAGLRADREAGPISRERCEIAHRSGDCALVIFQRSPLHIEVCS